mgnify:CR=1 FL=1
MQKGESKVHCNDSSMNDNRVVIQKRITALFLIIGKIAIVKPFAESHQHSRKRGKGMEKQEKNTVTPYDLDGRPPLKLAIPLGLQHVLAMFVGNLTPLLIITAACGIEAGGELQVALLQNAMADRRYCNIGSGIYHRTCGW